MSQEFLVVEDLWKSFGKRTVLKGVSFSVKKGGKTVIIGPSGAGKSTILRTINLLIRPDRGRIFLEGTEITSPKVDPVEVRKNIGFVFQHYNLFLHMNVMKNVMFGLVKVKKLPENEAKKRASEALRAVGIKESLWDKYPSQLSGGEQQRVAIARAIVMEPKLMLFDEPTSALDPELIGEVLDTMKKLAKGGMTMIVVTHELGFAASVADEVIFFDNGEIVEKGPPSKILFSPEKERTKEFLRKMWELYSFNGGKAQ